MVLANCFLNMELPLQLSVKRAILQTIVYADIFDYPLNFSEIERFLISRKKVALRQLQQTLDLIVKKKLLVKEEDFYFLPGRQKIIPTRKKRTQFSQQKLKIARRITKWLRLIPTFKMAAVTGALAMNNSDENDDIDILIVTSKNRLWLTRLFSVLLIELVTQRRRPADRRVKDKICLNMFLDEAHLKIPRKEQDLFTAHEVCQLKLLWDRDEIYQKFISQNQWYQKYLANWKP